MVKPYSYGYTEPTEDEQKAIRKAKKLRKKVKHLKQLYKELKFETYPPDNHGGV